MFSRKTLPSSTAPAAMNRLRSMGTRQTRVLTITLTRGMRIPVFFLSSRCVLLCANDGAVDEQRFQVRVIDHRADAVYHRCPRCTIGHRRTVCRGISDWLVCCIAVNLRVQPREGNAKPKANCMTFVQWARSAAVSSFRRQSN